MKFFWYRSFLLKCLLNLCQYCFYFMFYLFFCCEACEIFVPWWGIKPAPPALKGEVLTTRLPGKTPKEVFYFSKQRFYWQVGDEQCCIGLRCTANAIHAYCFFRVYSTVNHYEILNIDPCQTVGPCCLSVLFVEVSIY